MIFDLVAGVVLGFLVTVVCSPVGVSGALFLVPTQASLLGTNSLLITPTNLLFNVVAIPGALIQFARRGTIWNPLTRILLAGSAPGVILGTVIRTQLLPGTEAFQLVIAAVIGPLGAWMFFFAYPGTNGVSRPASTGILLALSFAVGAIGGIYGIGGGSILAPVLVGLGYGVALVAPAALASTFITSLVGIAAFAIIGLGSGQNLLPEWDTGIALGIGGLAGSAVGATIQPKVPEPALRKMLGLLALGIAFFCLLRAVT